MNNKFILLIGFYLVFIFSNLFSQIDEKELDELKQEIRLMIQKDMKIYKVVGISIALVDDQNVVWSEGFGYADQANNIPANSQTIYRVGSVSKLFTATSVMQLVENQKINLDEPIQTYIPEFKIKSRFEKQGEITARNLMTHHSGLPSDIENNFFCKNQIPFTEIVNDLNQEYTCFQPNTVFSYSNCGYTLLGVLVEKVSGENFYDYTNKYLFEPMQMKNSSFVLTDEMQKLYSKGYNRNKSEVNELYIRDVPAGMLHSNVEDLSNFIMMIFNNGKFNETQIIENKTLNQMLTKQNTNVPLDLNFEIGLGWWINSAEWNYAGKSAEHGGDTYVYHASIKLLTDQKIGVVVLTNSINGAIIKDKIAKIILQKYLKLKNDLENTSTNNVTKYKSAKNNDIKKHEGQYAYSGGFVFDVKAKNNKKLTFKQGGLKLALKYNDKNSYDVNLLLLGFIPINIKDQKISFKNIDNYDCMIVSFLSRSDSMILAVKTQKPIINENWTKRIGKYDIVNDSLQFPLFSDFNMYKDNGFLFLGCKIFSGQKYAMILKPINDNEAIVDGIGRSTGQTVFFKDDEIYISGLVLKKAKK